MEAFLTLAVFGSLGWFIAIMSVFVISLFISEYNHNGVAAFIVSIILVSVLHFEGSLPIWSIFTWSNALLYLGTGFVFSLFRTFIFARNEQKKYLASKRIKNEGTSEEKIKYDYDKVGIEKHIFRWWFMWPISLLYWVAGDLLVDLCEFLYERAKGIYDYVIKLAESTVK